ncbi:MAG TPA: phosphopantetheine-binding protein [Kineosporiaceae bacterium]
MSAPDLDDSLRTAIAAQLQVAPDVLTVDSDLAALGLEDDDTAVGVLEAVEALLDVRFPDDFLDGLETYGQLTSAVRIAIGE